MLSFALLRFAVLCFAMHALLCAHSADFFWFSYDFLPTLGELGGLSLGEPGVAASRTQHMAICKLRMRTLLGKPGKGKSESTFTTV
jgi:hypothetical protein